MSEPTQLDDGLPVTERLTVGLLIDAAAAIARVQERTGLKKADVINRAIVVYEFLDAEMREGQQLLLRHADGTVVRLKIV